MASTWLVFTFGVSFIMDTILFTLQTPSSLEMTHLYLSQIHGKNTKVRASTYKNDADA